MKNKIAKILINLGCLKLSALKPFTYASGLKGPIYCDNRLVISDVVARKHIVDAFVDLIKRENLQFDCVGALATAGIPHGAWISDRLEKPMVYIRSKAKEHGQANLVEGNLAQGAKVLLVEDLVNQGSSALKGVKAIKQASAASIGLVCIVDYGHFVAKEGLSNENCPLYSLTDFQTILAVWKHEKGLSDKEWDLLNKWHEDPTSWK